MNRQETIAAIEWRESVRSFTSDTPSLDELKACGAGMSPYLRVIAKSLEGEKVGSYGIISGSPAYVAVVCRDDELLEAGMAGERMVIELSARGLGTCWLGGTFDRPAVVEALTPMAPGERCAAIIAVGHAAPRRRMVERVMRMAVRSSKRRCVSDFIIAGAAPERLGAALEAVRLAPSACNRQPWRFAFNPAGSIDVYGTPSDRFMMLDVGIALAHFLAVEPGYRIEPNHHPHPTLVPVATLVPAG